MKFFSKIRLYNFYFFGHSILVYAVGGRFITAARAVLYESLH